MRKQTKKDICAALILMSGIFMAIIATELYYVGFHNVDLAVNMVNAGAKWNSTDINNDFVPRPLYEGYITGNNQQRLSFKLAFLSWLMVLGGLILLSQQR